jgi:hypothetical protein
MKKLFYAVLCFGLIENVAAQPVQPPAPPSCNSSNCTTPASETCSNASTVVANFINPTLRSGSPTSLPAVYTYYNISNISGQQVNATVTIESQSNCLMSGSSFSVDDDGATDQNGNSMTGFFAPRITPASNLTTTDQRGYVQFVIRFYQENGTAGEQYPGDYTTVPAGGLSGINYLHYDIDGSTVGTGGWFRETGLIEDVSGSLINADASTELVSYTYADMAINWKGFAGSVCERTGVSRCAQVAAAAAYNTGKTFIRFRMGYDYNYNGTNFNSQPTRQYGSRFGCFSFPQIINLPVKLLNFSGHWKNNLVNLNWSAENQRDFSGYEIERSIDGYSFEVIGRKNKEGNSDEKVSYQFTDNPPGVAGQTLFYRLKMTDLDNRYSYSSIVRLQKEGQKSKSLVLPNPVAAGKTAAIRYESGSKTSIDIAITDMSGKVILKQQSQVYEGVNTIALTNTHSLPPGLYIVNLRTGIASEILKLSVIK